MSMSILISIGIWISIVLILISIGIWISIVSILISIGIWISIVSILISIGIWISIGRFFSSVLRYQKLGKSDVGPPLDSSIVIVLHSSRQASKLCSIIHRRGKLGPWWMIRTLDCSEYKSLYWHWVESEGIRNGRVIKLAQHLWFLELRIQV